MSSALTTHTSRAPVIPFRAHPAFRRGLGKMSAQTTRRMRRLSRSRWGTWRTRACRDCTLSAPGIHRREHMTSQTFCSHLPRAPHPRSIAAHASSKHAANGPGEGRNCSRYGSCSFKLCSLFRSSCPAAAPPPATISFSPHFSLATHHTGSRTSAMP